MRKFLILLAALFFSTQAMAGESVNYQDGDVKLEGYVAKAANPNAPLVLIVHQWMGLTDNEKMRADMLAAAGYNAFAIDMYGAGVRAKDTTEAGALAGQYKGDPELARQRLRAALDYAKTIPGVDATRLAMFGYCFGGTMSLEAARMGADLKGVVSFHGGLASKAPLTGPGIIKAAVNVQHGAADTFESPQEIQTFKDEMNTAGADWTFTEYANAVHAFTQKEAGNDPSKGVAYNAKADKRSWQAALDFLKEVL